MAPDRLCFETRDLDLTLRHTFRIARGASDTRANLCLRLEHGGQVGLGEAAPIRRYGEDRDGARAVLEGSLPRLERPQAFAQAIRDEDFVGQRAAQAALDMALHDLAGKRLGAPVHALLGLDARRIPVTSYTIGMDTPEAVARKVREAGDYEVLKIKLGSPDDREMLAAVRDCTKRPLRVDANEGWTPAEALERLAWLARLGVEFVEQPLPAAQLEATRELRRRSPLPFFADESVGRAEDVPRLVGAFDGINVKLMKCGGLAAAVRLIAAARAHRLQVMLGCMIESSLGITAAAQLLPLADAADLDGHVLIVDDPFEGVRLERGRLVLPERPGLGVVERAGPGASGSRPADGGS